MNTKPETDEPSSSVWRWNLAEWARALFEGIDDAVFVHDLRGRILDANPAACRRLGYTREEMLKLNTRDIDDPDFAAGFQDRLERQMVDGRLRCEGKHRTKDGRTILVDINTSAIEFHGKPCVLAVMRDITERKRSEQALVKQKELLRSILENMGDGVLVVDGREQLIISNPVAHRLFGLLPPDGGPGARPAWPPPAELFLPDQITPFPPRAFPWTRAVQGKNVTDVQMFVRPQGFTRGWYVSLTARPLREGDQAIRGGIVVCRDVTEQKHTERRQQMQAAIARVITESKTSEVLGRTLMKALCEGLGWDVAVLWVVGPDGRELEASHVWFRPELALAALERELLHTRLPRGGGLAGRVWDQAGPVWVPDLAQDLAFQPVRAELDRAHLRSAYAFPVWSGGVVSGVVESLSRLRDQPDPDMQMLLANLGGQIGQVLERQRVEGALRESQAFYYSLVESLPQNLFRKDLQGRVTFANQRYCQLLKRTLPELTGKTDFDLFPEPLARKYREDDRKVLDTGRPLEVVEEHSLPGGNRIYVQVIKTPIHDAAGNMIGIQGLFWDVTKRIQAEQARAASERRYRQLTEATQDAIIVADREGRVTLFNPAAERLFGYAADEAIGQSVETLMPASLRSNHHAALERYLQTHVSHIMNRPLEQVGLRKDGTQFPLEIVLTVMEPVDPGKADHAGQIQFLAAIRDLTERNRMRSVLFQNEKLASIGQMSAGIAHEINNPLAFIGNNLAVLQRDLVGVMEILDQYEGRHGEFAAVAPEAAARVRALAEEIDLGYIRDNLGRLLERTREGVDRVARIVHSLRGLAHTGRPVRQVASLPDVIDTSLEIVRNKLKRDNIRVECEYDPDPSLSCMAPQLSQVFLNMFVNAIHAIEAAHPEGGGVIRVEVRRLADEMRIDLCDNGCGIGPDSLPRIFDLFFTTKDVGEGTGLGLYISHNIIQAHGGRVEVESTPGRGTTFHIYLPLNPG